MALDDPVVWVLIIAVVIFLFGSSKIPQFARALGQARKEFDSGWKGITNEIMSPTAATPVTNPQPPRPQAYVPPPPPAAAPTVSATTPQTVSSSDPLIVACQNEGIDTTGKTREQLASELSWKLNKK